MRVGAVAALTSSSSHRTAVASLSFLAPVGNICLWRFMDFMMMSAEIAQHIAIVTESCSLPELPKPESVFHSCLRVPC